MKKKWYQNTYRRNLVDMHIDDWNESFLSKFDPETYVDMLSLARVKSAMIYSNSHVGHCNWPTKVGHMHTGLGGRDILGETIRLCHERDMSVVVYYSLIYNNWAYDNNEDWRMITSDGKDTLERGRYGICCPNSPYKEFAIAEVEELLRDYKFEGIYYDMTFWPIVCYCDHCKKRYNEEVGGEIPTIIDWEDPKWLAFHKKRDEWLVEFAESMTGLVKKYSSDISVQHQSSRAPEFWLYGFNTDLAKQSDFSSGDFYGEKLQQSFVCKLYENLTLNKPFEFETTSCLNLGDHTTRKSEEYLEAQVFLALAHNGAFLFIDAIDPIGTLNRNTYEVMGNVFGKVQQYEQYLGGERCEDVGIYFSFDSKINLHDTGKEVAQASAKAPHVEAALGATKTLLSNHIPFGVITRRNLNDLSKYMVVILPNVSVISEEETRAFREYVRNGGCLYASKSIPVEFFHDALGISCKGEETKETVTYISPTTKGSCLFPKGISYEHPLCVFDSQTKVKSLDDSGVLATITLPYTNPDARMPFASIHSNPPGIDTEFPAIICKKFGKGKVLWSSGSIEVEKNVQHQITFANMVKKLAPKGFSVKTDAPKCIEITVFHQEDNERYIVNLVNFQTELPNIPINDVMVKVKVDDKRINRVMILPDEMDLPFTIQQGYVCFSVARVDTYSMVAIDYKISDNQ